MVQNIIIYIIYFILFFLCIFIVWRIVNRCVKKYINSHFYSKRISMLIILTLSVLCIITTLFYVRNDKHSYYYGFDCIFQTQKLPLGICPFYVMEYPQRFILICDVSNDDYD